VGKETNMATFRKVQLGIAMAAMTATPVLAQVPRYGDPYDRPPYDRPYDSMEDRREPIYQGSRTDPVERQQGGVTFVTGGVTKDEAQAFRAAMSRYSLALEFARANVPRGDFLAYVEVTITDSRGRQVLQTTSEGPFLLANLPAGQYTVRAGAQGQVKTQTVSVTPGQNRYVAFTW
jgi:hypothetical protein